MVPRRKCDISGTLVVPLVVFCSSVMILCKPGSWSSGNVFVSGVGGLWFKSRAGQIGHSVVNGSLRCDMALNEAVLPGRNDA